MFLLCYTSEAIMHDPQINTFCLWYPMLSMFIIIYYFYIVLFSELYMVGGISSTINTVKHPPG